MKVVAMKYRKILIVAVLAIIALFTIYLSSNDIAPAESIDNLQLETFKEVIIKDEKNGEWLEISKSSFVRLGTATYFLDKRKITILLTTTTSLADLSKQELEFYVEIHDADQQNRLAKFVVRDVKFKKFFHEVPLTKNFNYEMSAFFDLNRQTFMDTSQIKMTISINPSDKIGKLRYMQKI